MVARIEAGFDGPMPDEVREQAFHDLCDIDSDEVSAAVEALRLEQPSAGVPTGRMIRRQWADLALDAPPPAEAAAIVRELFARRRAEVGQHRGDGLALDELREVNPILAAAVQAFEGPPPFSPRQRREQWDPVYARAVQDERERLLFRRVPPARLPRLQRLQAA